MRKNSATNAEIRRNSLLPVGHYPESVVETLTKIAEFKTQGLDNETIKQALEKQRVEETKSQLLAQLAANSLQGVPPASPPPPPPLASLPPAFFTLPDVLKGIGQNFVDLVTFTKNMVRLPYPTWEPGWRKLYNHLLTLILIFGTLFILSLGFSDLTRTRLKRWLFSGFWDHFATQVVSIASPKVGREIKGEIRSREILNPIVDVNDVFEYSNQQAVNNRQQTTIKPRFPLEVDKLITNTFQVLKSAILNTTRLIGTLFVGQGDNYYISPAADASLRSLRLEETLEAQLISTEYLFVNSPESVANLNADFLDALDSSQFLRSDVSDQYTSGTLSFEPGTYLNIKGDVFDTTGNLTLADTVDIQQSLNVAANATIGGTLAVNGAGPHLFAGTLDPTNVAAFTLTGNITGLGSPNITGIGQFSGATAVLSTSVTSPLYTGTGAVTVSSGRGGQLALDSASGSIFLSNDSLTAVGSNITGSGALTVGSGGGGQLTLNSDSGLVRVAAGNALRADTLTDGTLSINSGSITGGVNAAFSGTVTAATKTITPKLENAGNITLDAINALADSTVYILNSDAGFAADLNVEGNITAGGGISGGAAFFTSLIVIGTSDLRGDVIDTTGNLTLSDSVDISGDLTVAGTGGVSLSGAGAGITFSGPGNHLLSATAGTLQLGAATLTGAIIGNNQNITGLNNVTGVTSSWSTSVTSPLFRYDGSITLDAHNASGNSTITLTNTAPAFVANVAIEGDLTVGGGISAGPTTYTNLTVTGWADFQGDVFDTTGNLTLADTVDVQQALNVAGSLTVASFSTFNGAATFNTDVDLSLAGTENLTIANTVTGTTSVDLITVTLTNNTTSGNQRGLVLNFDGSGVTEVGGIITYSGTGSGTTALEIAGTWGTAILTNNNNINAGTGTITGNLTCTDCLNFDDFADAMSLDDTTTVALGAYNYAFNLSGSGDFVIQSAGTPVHYFYDNGNVEFDQAFDTFFVNASTHRVGVGTVAPSSLFSVGSTSQFQVNSGGAIAAATGIVSSGNIDFSSLSAGGLVKAAATTGRLSIAAGGTDYEYPLTFSNGLTRTANTVRLGGTLTANTDIPLGGYNLTFSGTGNVGIGTTGPVTRLDVSGLTLSTDADGTIMSGRFTGSITKNDASSRTFHGLRILPTLNTGTSNANTIFNVLSIDTVNTATTGLTTRLISASFGGSERFRVDSAGNIVSATGAGWRPLSDSTSALNIQNAAGTASLVTFDTTNQRVGIGTTGPDEKLQVGANLRIRDGTWSDPATPDATAVGERVVLYKGGGWKTAIGMGTQNTLWVQAHTATTDPAFQVWTGAQSAAPTAKLTVRGDGNVGIGTTAPNSQLHISKYMQFGNTLSGSAPTCNATNEGVVLFNRDSTAERGLLYLCSWGGNDVPIYAWSAFGGGISGFINPDLAEYFKVDDSSIDYGDLIAISAEQTTTAIKANSSIPQTLLGIISTNPGIVLGEHSDTVGPDKNTPQMMWERGYRWLALAGRVPTKVSTKNGLLAIGDPITSSSLPGIGMKATKAGPIVGKALESTEHWNEQNCPAVSFLEAIQWPEDDGTNPAKPCFRLPDGTYVGKIMVFVNVSWYDPDVYLTSTGDLQLKNYSVNGLANYELKDKDDNLITRIGAFAELAVARVKAGTLEVAGKIKAGLIEAKSLITDSLFTDHLVARGDIISPIVRTNEIRMTENELRITNDAGGVVASFDEEGTLQADRVKSRLLEAEELHAARKGGFAELVAAQTKTGALEVTGDATVKGTLEAQKGGFAELVAEQVKTEALRVTGDVRVEGTLEADTIRAKKIEGVEFTQITVANKIGSDNEDSGISNGIAKFIEVISDKLQVIRADIGELRADVGEFVSVIARSIRTATLEVTETLTALFARIEILVARNLTVEEKITSPVASIGTLTSEAVNSKQLTVDRIEIRNEGETMGEAVIPAGEKELRITNNGILANSRIFVTPQVAIPVPLAVTKLTPKDEQANPPVEGSFTVELASPQEIDVPFHWWIVKLATGD